MSTAIAPAASPVEAAAIVAALEQFRRTTAPPLLCAVEQLDPWVRAAILEGVGRADPDFVFPAPG